MNTTGSGPRAGGTGGGVTLRLIKRPSPGFWAIFEQRRVRADADKAEMTVPDAVGLIQGPVAAMLAAADIAEKAAAVKVVEVRGVCPTHFTVVAVLGDTSAVAAALTAVAEDLDDTCFR